MYGSEKGKRHDMDGAVFGRMKVLKTPGRVSTDSARFVVVLGELPANGTSERPRTLTDLPAGQPARLGLGAGQLLATFEAPGRALARLRAAFLPVERGHAHVRVLGHQVVRHLAGLATGRAPVRAARAPAATHAAPAVNQAHRGRAALVALARRRHLWHGRRGRLSTRLCHRHRRCRRGLAVGERAQRHARAGRRIGGQSGAQRVRRLPGCHVRPVQARAQQLQTVIPVINRSRISTLRLLMNGADIRMHLHVVIDRCTKNS